MNHLEKNVTMNLRTCPLCKIRPRMDEITEQSGRWYLQVSCSYCRLRVCGRPYTDANDKDQRIDELTYRWNQNHGEGK